VILRTVGEAEKLARQAADGDKANAFANLILSRILVDPARSPEEIDSLPSEAIVALVEVAATSIGSRPEFDALPSNLPPRVRLYQSHLEAERTHFEKLNREIAALRKSVDAAMEPIHRAAQATLDASPITALSSDHIDEFFGRTAAISAKLMADDAAAMRASLDQSLLATLDDSYGLALKAAMSESLSELMEAATRGTPPEPFLSDALIAAGINTSLLHSPTYTLPPIEAIESAEEVEPRARRAEQRRLVDAYDALSYLELTLRELIESKLRELHGRNWWERGVPETIRNGCEMRKRGKEASTGRSHHAITYAYVDDYRAIILKGDNWRQLFSTSFPTRPS
jgi:hypothetical protein